MNPAQYEDLLSLLNDIGFRLDRLSGHLGIGTTPAPAAPKPAAQQPAQAYEVASDEDLDGKYGDPEVRRDPPRWKGENMAGRRYSETTPEFLEVMAGFLTWAAEQAEAKNETTSSGQPRAPYLRRDAARARGWRARLLAAQPAVRSTAHNSSKEARESRQQGGYQPPPQPVENFDAEPEGDLPF